MSITAHWIDNDWKKSHHWIRACWEQAYRFVCTQSFIRITVPN
jgi:hypothetical protein